MFTKPKDRRIAKEADKIISLKEDLDSVSWSRILEIGCQLETRENSADSELGAELVAIAQSNITLGMRLGIDQSPAENRVMASGIEVVEGGLAQAALDTSASLKALASEKEDSYSQGKEAKEADRKKDLSGIDTFADSSLDSFTAVSNRSSMKGNRETVGPRKWASAPGAKRIYPEGVHSTSGGSTPRKSVFYTVAGGIDSGSKGHTPGPSSSEASPVTKTPSRHPSAFADYEPQKKEYVSMDEIYVKPRQTSQTADQNDGQAKREDRLIKERVACFRNLYESRDGGLCTFMDDQGHLVSVDSSKFV